MKTLTQVVLPIAALAGVVFGITYVMNYSTDRPKEQSGGPSVRTTEPLKFWAMTGQRQADPKSKLWFQKYWQDNFELGEDGHYDFWFSNLNLQPVRIAFTTANCQCAGADLGIIAPDDLSRYFSTLTAANWPQSGGPVLAAVNALQLKSAIQWTSLARDGKKQDGSVPAASDAAPQFGLLRLNWKAREPEGDRTVTAQFAAQLPGANPSPLNFEAKFIVAPPFGVFSPSSGGRTVRLGEIGPRARVGREFFVWSRTRPAMDLTITPKVQPNERDCVRIGTPVQLQPSEITALTGQDATALGANCAYRVPVSVDERAEIEINREKIARHLDLGPVDFVIRVSTDEDKFIDVPVHGLVRGEIHLVGGGQSDRVDFGNSFSSSESRTTQVTLMAEREDVRLELDREASSPEFLREEIQLRPEAPKDGKSFWTLRVTIPANKLYGDLKGAYVVLKTGEGGSRRMRIPIRANTFDGPRF